MNARRCGDFIQFYDSSYRCQGDAGHNGVHWADHEDGERWVMWLARDATRPFDYADTVERHDWPFLSTEQQSNLNFDLAKMARARRRGEVESRGIEMP